MNQLSPGSGLWVADQLYRAGKSPLILISGGNAFDSKHPPESALAARLLIDWGIPPAAILTEQQSAPKTMPPTRTPSSPNASSPSEASQESSSSPPPPPHRRRPQQLRPRPQRILRPLSLPPKKLGLKARCSYLRISAFICGELLASKRFSIRSQGSSPDGFVLICVYLRASAANFSLPSSE